MLHFNGTIIGEDITWELIRYDDDYIDDGITISFPLPWQLSDREALNYLKIHLPEKEQRWLSFTPKKWTLNLSVFRDLFHDGLVRLIAEESEHTEEEGVIRLDYNIPTNLSLDLFNGLLDVKPEVSHRDLTKATRTTINFIFTYDQLMDNQPKRIFLSHKSADKPMVRAYRDMLKTLGFEPWMDEDDLKAGDKLHRGIAQGFKDSCAAIFFITSNYKDEKYLATEVEYAITEHYNKGDGFRIISLVIADDIKPVQIPGLLEPFVYKHPKTQFEGLTEIIKALPIKLETTIYKAL